MQPAVKGQATNQSECRRKDGAREARKQARASPDHMRVLLPGAQLMSLCQTETSAILSMVLIFTPGLPGFATFSAVSGTDGVESVSVVFCSCPGSPAEPVILLFPAFDFAILDSGSGSSQGRWCRMRLSSAGPIGRVSSHLPVCAARAQKAGAARASATQVTGDPNRSSVESPKGLARYISGPENATVPILNAVRIRLFSPGCDIPVVLNHKTASPPGSSTRHASRTASDSGENRVPGLCGRMTET